MDMCEVAEIFKRIDKQLNIADRYAVEAKQKNSRTPSVWELQNGHIRDLIDMLRVELDCPQQEGLRSRLISAYQIAAQDRFSVENKLLLADELAGKYLHLYGSPDVIWVYRQIYENHIEGPNADDIVYKERQVLGKAQGLIKQALCEGLSRKKVAAGDAALCEDLIEEFKKAVALKNAVAEGTLSARELAGHYLHFYSFTDDVDWVVEQLITSKQEYSPEVRHEAVELIRVALT